MPVAADEPCKSCETTLKRRSLTYRKFCKRDFGENMHSVFPVDSKIVLAGRNTGKKKNINS